MPIRNISLNTKFYTFNQNNSGGTWFTDEKRGIGICVIIEAQNSQEANFKAEQIGLYFNGYRDCSCCGRRWSEVDEGSACDFPTLYGEKIDLSKQTIKAVFDSSFYKDNLLFIHYYDGTIQKLTYV